LEKKLIRKVYLEERKSLSEEAFLRLQADVIDNAIHIIKQLKPSVVHCYIPIPNMREINTDLIFEYCWLNNIETVVPVSNFINFTMKTAIRNPSTKMKISKNGIIEPVETILMSASKIDLIITPLIAFDHNGHRVGFGKGFYDRFFEKCSTNTTKMGLSLFDSINKIEDVNNHDFPLDYVATPNNIATF
tara:strand:- start:1105 stop:1671 length:567 start_codon:yes stop_codon:yes gene_type:complete